MATPAKKAVSHFRLAGLVSFLDSVKNNNERVRPMQSQSSISTTIHATLRHEISQPCMVTYLLQSVTVCYKPPHCGFHSFKMLMD